MKPIKFLSIWKPKPKLKLWAVWQKPKEVSEQDVLNSIKKILNLIDNNGKHKINT